MDKVNEEDFEPIFVVGLYKGNPAVRTLSYEEGLSSLHVSGMMTAILDCVVDLVDEQDQAKFEKDIIDSFIVFAETRYGNSNKYKLEDDDD